MSIERVKNVNIALAFHRDVDHIVRNTIINKAGAEYSGAAGINVGYTQRVTIHGNDVSNMSYVICSTVNILPASHGP